MYKYLFLRYKMERFPYYLEEHTESEWESPGNRKMKFVIDQEQVSALGVYEETIGWRIKGKNYLQPISEIRNFEDGIRIALQRDYGASNDFKHKEKLAEEIWLKKFRLKKQIEKLPLGSFEEMDPLNDKIQELTAKYDELSSRSGVGKSSVVKVVMGSDGIYSDKGLSVYFYRFPILANNEALGEKWNENGRKRITEAFSVKALANRARHLGVSSFTMQFSNMTYTNFQKKYKHRIQQDKMRRNKKDEEERDRRDFMQADEELLFLSAPLRF